ncbi:hypothetical protein PVAP13_8KG170501 [Panicum virgatum]|uniref:Uncharacterized protein n=1 Tax=Panicum virgatum TaxID=38727 RepID=A0A8T0PM27_PANVG|nr:hypothetical protein PVAP13_8KG170501 [Panicum virgatum]
MASIMFWPVILLNPIYTCRFYIFNCHVINRRCNYHYWFCLKFTVRLQFSV